MNAFPCDIPCVNKDEEGRCKGPWCIRLMSDEELAEFLFKPTPISPKWDCSTCSIDNSCTECVLEWLRKEKGDRMTVVERKPVPIYEVTCFECGSKLHYKKADVSNCFIKCPVCGVSTMAVPLDPIGYEDGDGHPD